MPSVVRDLFLVLLEGMLRFLCRRYHGFLREFTIPHANRVGLHAVTAFAVSLLQNIKQFEGLKKD
jgi:hypothetical protein